MSGCGQFGVEIKKLKAHALEPKLRFKSQLYHKTVSVTLEGLLHFFVPQCVPWFSDL